MARFFFIGELIENHEVTLSREESHHLARVLKLKTRDEIQIIDGKGKLAEARVLDSNVKATQVLILGIHTSLRRSRVTVCFGIPKAHSLDFIFHRCTELGIEGFQPLTTQHSLNAVHWNELRWKRTLLEVCKQCEAVFIPTLSSPLTLASWLSHRDNSRPLVLCHEEKRNEKLKLDSTSLSCDLLVGPEGGWSSSEDEILISHGAIRMGLGINRLRAETSAVVAAVLLKQHLGEYP